MSDQTKRTDYTILFEYPTLPKIHVEPDYKQFKNPKNKLKRNDTQFPSDFDGGRFGHIGLVLSPAEYANISATPYVRPLRPGVLIIPPNTSECVEKRHRDEHKYPMASFHETIDIENK